ncbi:type I restriction enzyme, R subunit [Desulfomicrobium norvegicum]|uniref:Type I restriction enzyme endonuclease subunit n=1 Tax=Desulfomicrobium norvegicum (strain DSM 1741 / NCIMB 8310) TaxID=52561 RepID=A0A8G2C6C6_DESNO|nr:type I restriction endonuclease subunit R [Desulfomicrobium norvegicum]SFM24364.1 type I restriction enzyme, R subunit [Desulfomicrobium norvegicum]
MITDIHSEDRLVQATFANHLHDVLGWESIFAHNAETFGPSGTLGRANEREVVLIRDLRAAVQRLNPDLPDSVYEQAVEKLTRVDFTRSLIQHNKEYHTFIRTGVPVEWRDAGGQVRHARARVIDFLNPANNRFLAVRELKIQGLRVPHYNRRADLVCFVNGLPLVFIELKAVYLNMRAGYDNNLTDYLSETSINHAFHHNAFLIVSNGDRARYGSITSKWEHFVEWKRNDEKERGSVEAEVLLNGMLAKERLLDLVENFILFDDSRPGGTRKIVARNHQVLGVNNAISSVKSQELLKEEFPLELRLRHRVSIEIESTESETPKLIATQQRKARERSELPALIERAHPDLGRLGVFWHTQGSGKSYSMVMFTEKVRRHVPGNFTFVIMTDREDLDDQIWRTFVGCGMVDPNTTPRANSGKDLKTALEQNHSFVFTLIHKFNQPVDEKEPYSERDDIIVISDEAHRTQSGKFARNMRLALPNASFIGFTGTPLFKYDHLTKRIFGGYISRYDFKRSEEDQSTVKLIYENRGEKLGIARLDLNDRIAEKIEQAGLDADQEALLDKLLGQDYEVITADDRLDKLAVDFVNHCSTRWECGKSLLVCIDKITCARMFQRIKPRWNARLTNLQALIQAKECELATTTDTDQRETLTKALEKLRGQTGWMQNTIIEIIISEAQNEVRDFAKWGFDIIPHRMVIKNGFETPDGKRVNIEDAFKNDQHPFRIAIVCAMWLTGFDVECLQTLYIDKPLKAHTLMQAIARANRIYPGKDSGVIVDYNGMLKSLRAALADYALGEGGEGGETDPAIPLEEYVPALVEAIEAAEKHLRDLGFEPNRLTGSTGFARIAALRDAVDALYTTDEAKRRYEIMARAVFSRMKTLILEPSIRPYYIRHDNIEAIYKKLNERRDTADVTEVLKEIYKIVNDAIRTQAPGDDQADGLTVDLSQIDFEKLRDEFAKKVKRKHSALQAIRELVEQKLAQMLARNPTRMDYYKQYQMIVADYNREKDRATVEETFAKVVNLVAGMDDELQRHVREGLSEEELTFFDLLLKENITKVDREKLKQASKGLLASLKVHLASMPTWTKNVATQADVKMFILDNLYMSLPRPPFTEEETNVLANNLYSFVYQQSVRGPVMAA